MPDDTPNEVDLDYDNDGEDEMAWDQFLIEFCLERQKNGHPDECVCGYHEDGVKLKAASLSPEEEAEIDRRLKARREGN